MRGQHVSAIDAWQEAALDRWRDQLPALRDHHVVNGTFGYFPPLIEEEGIIEPPGSRIGKHSIVHGPPGRLMP